MYLRSFETITISLRRLQSKNSTSLTLFLRFFDFDDADDRQHEEFVEREQVFADNVDLGRPQKPSFCWWLLMLGCRASIPFALSSNFGGAVFFNALE